MSSKRDVLERLKRDELLAAVGRFGLEGSDRRRRAGLLEALAGSGKATLAETLEDLPWTRLKEICRALRIDESGGDKALLIDRLPRQTAAPEAELLTGQSPGAARDPFVGGSNA